jgi:Leucine-rich repeat (LRR) protein
MKKIVLFLLLCSLTTQGQIINIPDANFKAVLLNTLNVATSNNLPLDSNNNGEIEQNEALFVTNIGIVESNVTNVTGIEYFTNLKLLNVFENNITTLDFTMLPSLEYLYINSNPLTSLNVTGLVNLKELTVVGSNLNTLDASSLTSLTLLNCNSNLLSSVNVAGLSNLKEFRCGNNQLTSLNLTGLPNLESLFCDYNELPAIDFTGLTSAKIIYCTHNQLTSLNLTGLPNLLTLNCDYNLINSLNFLSVPNLVSLSLGNNPMTSINLNGLINLLHLTCDHVQATTLNLAPLNYGGISKLKWLDCSYNQLTNLDLTGKVRLTKLKCNNNLLTSINVANFPDLQKVYCDHNLITTLDFSTNPLFNELSCSNNNLTTIKINNGTNQVLSGAQYFGDCFDNNPNLNLICADATEITPLQSYLTACGNTQNITINTTCSLEVEGHNSPKIGFFPNPTHDKVYFDNSINRYDHVMVYNSLGQLILDKKIDFTSYETIDLSGFTKGIYLIKGSNTFENQTSIIVKE